MHKKIKLFILILLSSSVYFIYLGTNNSTYTILNIGEKRYGEYLKEYYEIQKDKVILNNKYTEKDQTIKNLLLKIQETPSIKKDLANANLLLLNIGYNDVIYKEAREENPKDYYKEIDKNYQLLIKEIKKYYHNKIIVIGYYNKHHKDMTKLNNILKSSKDILYIDTSNLLKKEEKYFDNSSSYDLNHYGYCVISKKIIRKTLEIQENI